MKRMMQTALALFVFASMCSCCRLGLCPRTKVMSEGPAAVALPAERVIAEEKPALASAAPLICKRTRQPIVVDGRREALWDQSLTVTRFFVPTTGKEPVNKTEVSCLWDEQAFYVFFQAQDKDLWAYFQQRDDNTYLDDVLEVFIAYGDKDEELQYVNFEINALGTIYDAYAPCWTLRALMHHWKRWDCRDLQVAVTVQGTLNEHDDEDQGWTLEMAIPFASLPWMKDRPHPQPGEEWRGHFSRIDYSIYIPGGRELSSTTAFERPNFHQVDKFQALRFDE
jgi:hypothetical protein